MSTQVETFSRPPLHRVTLSVALHPEIAPSTLDLFELWRDHLSTEFPKPQEAPALRALGREKRVGSDLHLDIRAHQGQPIRLWMKNPENNEILQLQSNWLAQTWERGEPYPRYDTLRNKFSQRYQEVVDFAQTRGHETPEPLQVHLTYENELGPVGDQMGEGVERYLSFWAPPNELTGRIQDLRFSWHQPIVDQHEAHCGELHVVSRVRSSTRAKTDPKVELSLSARGRPLSKGLEGVLSFADLAHSTIVESFVTLTTADMHREWGRQ